MKIFICCSKHFYDRVSDIRERLEELGHEITLPNSYNDPFKEEEMKERGEEEHSKWKGGMIKAQIVKIVRNDAILVLNYDKHGSKNYIGGATFLEMYECWKSGKKIFLYNEIPEGILSDEIRGFNPRVIHGRLEEIL